MAQQEEGPRAPFIGDFLVNRWNDASRELDPAYVQAFVEYVDGGSQGEPPKPLYKLSAAWVKLLDTTITLWMSDYDQILQCLDFLNPAKQGQITTRASAYHLSFWHQLMYNLCEKTCQLAVQSVRVYLKTADSSYKKQVEAQLKKDIKKIEVEFGKVRPQLVHGRGNNDERTSWAVENWESMLFLGGDGLTAMEQDRRESVHIKLSYEDQWGMFQRRLSDTFAVFESLGIILGRLEVLLQQARPHVE